MAEQPGALPFQWSVVLTEEEHLHHFVTRKGRDGFIEIDGWEVSNTTQDEEIDSVHGFISKTISDLRHNVIVMNPVIQAAVQEQISDLEAYLSGEKFPFEWVVTDRSGASDLFWEGKSKSGNADHPVPTVRSEYADCSTVGQRLLPSLNLAGLSSYMQAADQLKVVVMCGAGISTSAGIPDYRSAGGIFERMREEHPELAADNRPPEDLFSISHFRENPNDFLTRMKYMYTDLENVEPTRTHKFLRELEEKGMLLRVYTQNIDGLERKAGVSPEKLVEVHGTIQTVSGNDSKQPYSLDEFKEALREDKQDALFAKHGEVIRPDVVMYGEAINPRFAECSEPDVAECNCLIVLGTSLKVSPFNTLVGRVGIDVPRVLINRDPVAVERKHPAEADGTMRNGFRFEGDHAYRDVFLQRNTDDAVTGLSELLGWN
mmetsp:Transcript_54846/g.129360  ORF Transcript_54846/g.129360 Transcript_54846/m.129360 type:complete len:431 (-) Transcript_54846:85-1377(-)